MVQPPARAANTSGSRPTEAGVGGSSSSTDPAPKKQRVEGTLYPWANIPTGYVPEIREEDSQPEVIDLEEDEPEVNPWIPLKKADTHWDCWSYPIDAGVYGQRQLVSPANVTLGACALYTLIVGKGRKGQTGAEGTCYEAEPIDTTNLENTLGWRLLMKCANLTEEEKQRIKQSAAMPPVVHSGLMYSRRSVEKLAKQRWRPRGEEFNASETIRLVAASGSGSRPTEAAASSSDDPTAARVQVFPEGANKTPIE